MTKLKLAELPLKVTEVVPVKFAPLIVTLVPMVPLVGAKEVIAGGNDPPPVTVKLGVPRVPVSVVPPGVVTTMSPDPVAAAPTVARI